MGRDDMVGLTGRWQEAFNRHDVVALDALYAIDCKVESPMAAGQVQGRQAVAKVYQSLFDGFPDIHFTLETTVIDGDTVAVSGWLTGTYTGGFMGLPPSGKPVRVPAVTIIVAADHRIIAERRIYDFTGMLVQAGVLKARPA